MTDPKVIIEFSIHEAEIIRRALSHYSPPKEDEMVSFMLFNRIKTRIAEAIENEHP
jgi:hypothetical protein